MQLMGEKKHISLCKLSPESVLALPLQIQSMDIDPSLRSIVFYVAEQSSNERKERRPAMCECTGAVTSLSITSHSPHSVQAGSALTPRKTNMAL